MHCIELSVESRMNHSDMLSRDFSLRPSLSMNRYCRRYWEVIVGVWPAHSKAGDMWAFGMVIYVHSIP